MSYLVIYALKTHPYQCQFDHPSYLSRFWAGLGGWPQFALPQKQCRSGSFMSPMECDVMQENIPLKPERDL